MKYTKDEVRGMFNRLLKAAGKSHGTIYRKDGFEGIFHVEGGWSLDYASVYGGYVIEQQEESGGISHPYGSLRRTAKEMYLSMHMTAQALEDISYRKLYKKEVI